MNKTDHIQYWKRTAADSWITTEALFSTNRYVESVFWAHLTLEKLLKAHWVQDNVTHIPPRVHNLLFLLGQTSLSLTKDEIGDFSFYAAKGSNGACSVRHKIANCTLL